MRTLLCLKNEQVQRSLYFPFYLMFSSAVLGQESTGAAESSPTCQERPRVLLIVAASSGYCASIRTFLIQRILLWKNKTCILGLSLGGSEHF